MSEIDELYAFGREGNWLFHGSPIPPEDLEPVQMPDGSYAPALRPTVPMTYDHDRKMFVPDDDEAVLCATVHPESAVFRALCHPVFARQLGLDRRLGRNGSDDDADELSMWATEALLSAIRGAGALIVAHVAMLERRTPPFTRSPRASGEYRSTQPALPARWFRVAGNDLPAGIEVVPPYAEVRV
jgi:hypothetical protein